MIIDSFLIIVLHSNYYYPAQCLYIIGNQMFYYIHTITL